MTLNALRELPELLKRVALSMPARCPPLERNPCGSWLARERAEHIRHLMLTDRTPSLSKPAPTGSCGAWAGGLARLLQRHSKKPLPADFSEQLAQLAYAPDDTLRALPAPQRQALFDTCQHWVEHHHVAA